MRLYLDVDGVCCPLGRPGSDFGDWDDSGGYPVSAEMGALLGDLNAEVVWLSTWQEGADTIGQHWGWTPRPHLHRAAELLWWKLEALERDHPPGVAFVWVDDELTRRAGDLGPLLAKTLASLEVPHLLISPDERCGLTRAEIATIAAWIDTVDAH